MTVFVSKHKFKFTFQEIVFTLLQFVYMKYISRKRKDIEGDSMFKKKFAKGLLPTVLLPSL